MSPRAICHREVFVRFDALRRRWSVCEPDAADAVIEVHGDAASVADAVFRLGPTRWNLSGAWADFGWFRVRGLPSRAPALDGVGAQ